MGFTASALCPPPCIVLFSSVVCAAAEQIAHLGLHEVELEQQWAKCRACDPEFLNAGEQIYFTVCAFCPHSVTSKGLRTWWYIENWA